MTILEAGGLFQQSDLYVTFVRSSRWSRTTWADGERTRKVKCQFALRANYKFTANYLYRLHNYDCSLYLNLLAVD